MYAFYNKFFRIAKANTNKIKEDTHKSSIIVENMKTSLSIVDTTKITKKKERK